jgi:O-antigen/teichoic acid export membrane protein
MTGAAIRYVLQIVLAWVLGAVGFGVYALGAGVYQVAELFARLGLGAGSVRFVSVHRSAGDLPRLKGILLQSRAIPMVAGCIVGFLLFLLAPWLSTAVFEEPSLATPLRVFAVGVPLGAIMNVVAFSTTGFQVTTYLVWVVHIIFPTVNLLFILVLVPTGVTIVDAAAAWVFASAIAALAAIGFSRKLLPELRQKKPPPIFETKKVLKVSLPLVGGDLTSILMIWIDVLILGAFAATADVGIYRAASQTAFLLAFVGFAIESIFQPLIAHHHATGEEGAKKQLFQVATRWQLTLVLPFFLVETALAPDLLSVFGPEFAMGALPLIILASAQLVQASAGASGAVLIMTGHEVLKLYGDLAVLASNIALNLILIPRFGVLGAASATGTSLCLMALVRLVLVVRAERIHPYTRDFLRPIVAGVLALITVMLVSGALASAHFLVRLAVGSTALGLVFGVTLLALGLPEADRSVLRGGLDGLARVVEGWRNKKA